MPLAHCARRMVTVRTRTSSCSLVGSVGTICFRTKLGPGVWEAGKLAAASEQPRRHTQGRNENDALRSALLLKERRNSTTKRASSHVQEESPDNSQTPFMEPDIVSFQRIHKAFRRMATAFL